MVTLLRITSPPLGNFVKNKLEAEGIEIFFTNEGLTLGSHYNPDEVFLKVKAKDSEKAVKILLQLHKDFDLDKVATDKTVDDMKKILLPVKLGNKCIEVCRYAMQLATKMNAEVKLLYVYPDPTFNEPEKHTASWEKHVNLELKEAFLKAQQKLVNFSKELKKNIPDELHHSSRIHYRILKGIPQNVITDACKRYQPNLVIMGTNKKKAEEGEFLGKTLLKVLETTQTPILTLPTSARFKMKDKMKIMYATDFYESDNSSLNKLLEILESCDKEIHCVHFNINEDPDHQKKVDELNNMLEKEYSDYNIKCVLFESENLEKGFDKYVEKNNIDIISLSKIKRSAFYRLFHSDLLAKLVSVEKVPILIFPV